MYMGRTVDFGLTEMSAYRLLIAFFIVHLNEFISSAYEIHHAGKHLLEENDLFKETLSEITERLYLLEERDRTQRRDIEDLRVELQEERQRRLQTDKLMNKLIDELKLQKMEIKDFVPDPLPEEMAPAMVKPEFGSLNVLKPEVYKNQKNSVTRISGNLHNKQTLRHEQTKKALSWNTIQFPEQPGDVAFFAKLGNHLLHLGTNEDIPFDIVVTNNGNAYNQNNGTFIAPVAGTYVFSTTLRVQGANNTHYTLVQNSHVVSNIYIRGLEAPYSSSSLTAVLDLKGGDVVAIKNKDVGVALNGNSHSSFAGFLLKVDFTAQGVLVGKRRCL